jgi:hypothetical protein
MVAHFDTQGRPRAFVAEHGLRTLDLVGQRQELLEVLRRPDGSLVTVGTTTGRLLGSMPFLAELRSRPEPRLSLLIAALGTAVAALGLVVDRAGAPWRRVYSKGVCLSNQDPV